MRGFIHWSASSPLLFLIITLTILDF